MYLIKGHIIRLLYLCPFHFFFTILILLKIVYSCLLSGRIEKNAKKIYKNGRKGREKKTFVIPPAPHTHLPPFDLLFVLTLYLPSIQFKSEWRHRKAGLSSDPFQNDACTAGQSCDFRQDQQFVKFERNW